MVSNLRGRAPYLLLMVCVLLLLAACGGGSSDETESAAATGPVRFLYFSAADCAPCDDMAPII